jgi:hypothetical protein
MDNQTLADDLVNSELSDGLGAQEGVTTQRDPLTLELDDAVFIKTATKLIDDSKSFFEEKLQLKDRRARNKKFRFGRQLDDVRLKDYNAKYIDNIIWESEAYIKAMATSRLPDIIVKPGSDSPQSKQTAEALSKVVSADLQSRARKRVLSLAFSHLPVYLIGAIKAYWDPQKGKNGDMAFRVVHPDNLIVDHKAVSNDSRDMDFIAEAVEYTVKEWVMRFPDKEQEFYTQLHNSGVFNNTINEKTEAGLNSKVKGWEIWFTWYEKAPSGFTRVEGVAWFYKQLLFKKMKSPNWDWTGETQVFNYDSDQSSQVASLADMQSVMSQSMSDPNVLNQLQSGQVFHNHLDYPEKPYIFLGYDQWGETPIDETSRIEQVVLMQENYDKRGKQVTEMLDRSRGKHVFSSDSGMQKDDVEGLDLADPDIDLLVKGKVSEVHAFIPGEQPSAPMIQDKNDLRERIFDKMGVHGPARGEVDMGSPATNNQLSREGDFTRSDDLVDDTITYAAEKIANWILQFIKLRYTEDHLKRLLGEDGKTVFTAINRDMVEDGMEVTIGASGTDKLKAQQNAMDMAKLQLIDPFSFYTDIGAADPKGRTQRLVQFLDPNMRSVYLQSLGIDVASQMSGALNQMTPGGPSSGGEATGNGGQQQALMDIAQIQQGQIPQVPQQVDPGYLQTFTNFMHSPELEQFLSQHPELKDQILQFASQVANQAQNSASSNVPPAGASAPPDRVGGPIGQVGPTGSSPSPANTQRVAITAPGRA